MRWTARALVAALVVLSTAGVGTTATGDARPAPTSMPMSASSRADDAQPHSTRRHDHRGHVQLLCRHGLRADRAVGGHLQHGAAQGCRYLTTNNLGKVSKIVAPKNTTKYQFKFVGRRHASVQPVRAADRRRAHEGDLEPQRQVPAHRANSRRPRRHIPTPCREVQSLSGASHPWAGPSSRRPSPGATAPTGSPRCSAVPAHVRW